MFRTAEIVVSLPFTANASVDFDDAVEVSLDCHVCRRCQRTVKLSIVESVGTCFPSKHAFPGRITAKDVTRDLHLSTARYRVLYEYESFIDEKYSETMNPSGDITWARVGFTITCPACGRITEASTQNNLVRPFQSHCQCGQLLYSEEKVMPVFSRIDEESPNPDHADAVPGRTKPEPHPVGSEKKDPGPRFDTARMILVLAFYGLLFLLCTQAPLYLAAQINPLVGSLAALAAIPLWLYFVRPTPGLAQAFICLIGVFGILIVNIVFFFKLVYWLIH